MKHKLILPAEFEKVLSRVPSSTKAAWAAIGLSDQGEVMDTAITKLNKTYPKLELTGWEFREQVIIDKGSSTYFGILEDEDGICDGYITVIPPKYETRSGVLAQQIFPPLSSIMETISDSKDNRLSNRPIFVINMNEVNFTGAMAVNVLSGMLLGFGYVDLFDRDVEKVLEENGMSPGVRSVEEYDKMLKKNNKQGVNGYFELDIPGKVIYFLPDRLKDGVAVNNEPYWFVLRAYAALYLAIQEGYRCDMTKFDVLKRGNKTLDVFRKYVNQF